MATRAGTASSESGALIRNAREVVVGYAASRKDDGEYDQSSMVLVAILWA